MENVGYMLPWGVECGCALTCKNDKYVIIFDGKYHYEYKENKQTTNIYVCDFETEQIATSSIKCPFYGGKYEGLIINDNDLTLILINGYCRRNIKKRLISLDIVYIIKLMMGNEYEYVHLIHKSTGEHCKILLQHILDSLVWSEMRDKPSYSSFY